MFFSVNAPFNESEVRDYERRRYRGLDQRLVHRREVRILRAIMKRVERVGGPAGDVDLNIEEAVGSRAPDIAVQPAWTARRTAPRWPRLALDAPCGYGRFSSFLVERGYRLASADLSFHMVKRARSRGDISIIPMGIVCNFVSGLPFRAGVFGLVLSMRLFHHLHRPEERRSVLGEFNRVAGGWVILSYYQANLLHRLQRAIRRLIKRSRTRIRMISRREFREEVEAAGFEIVRVFPLFRGIHSHHIALLKKAQN
ncbi:MAG: class I SAM-dependent methyltransferase [Clostridiales bacterium]|nr:class I SAM-dependent methyltransferase [Clostridiales bacterium]